MLRKVIGRNSEGRIILYVSLIILEYKNPPNLFIKKYLEKLGSVYFRAHMV